MVRIDVSLNTDYPQPLTTSQGNSSSSARNRKTGIPVLKKSDKYERLLSINQSLAKKCKIKPSKIDLSPRQDVDPCGIQALLKEIEQQEEQINSKSSLLADVEEESSEVKLLNRALRNEISEIKNVISELEGKFEYLLSRITTKVENEERDINLDLMAYQTKLEDSYSDAKFELENEIASALQYEDTEALDEVKSLKERKSSLETQLSDAITARAKALEEEQSAMQKEIDEALESKKNDVEELTAKYLDAQNEFQAVMSEFEQLNAENDSACAAIKKLRDEISSYEKIFDDFNNTKHKLKSEVNTLNEELREIRDQDARWSEKVAESRCKFKEQELKHQKYNATRRILEHGIARYETKNRMFLRVGNGESSDELRLKLIFDTLDKISPYNVDEHYSQEWELFVQDSLLHQDICIIYSGQAHNLLNNLRDIYTFLKQGESVHNGWKFTHHLQSLTITDSNLSDQFNESTETCIELKNSTMNVVSQKMILRNELDLRPTLLENGKPTCQIFTTSAENTTSGEISVKRLFVITLTKLSLTEQSLVLGRTDECGPMSTLLLFLKNHLSILNVCDIRTIQETGAEQLLRTLSKFR